MPQSADIAYDHVKRAILSGRHASGERLPEDRIAGALGLSRTPVRDALRRLEVEGLVERLPHSGARVAAWSEDELAELAAMRLMLEGYAAELAARKIDAAGLAALRRCCDAMEAARDDMNAVTAENLRFHRLLAEAADNGRLRASLEPLWPVPLLMRKFSLFGADRIARSVAHHREISDALAARDPHWAGAIMRAHLSAARGFDPMLAPDPDMAETDRADTDRADTDRSDPDRADPDR